MPQTSIRDRPAYTPYEDFEPWVDRVHRTWIDRLAELRKVVEANPPKAWLEVHLMIAAAMSMEEEAKTENDLVNLDRARQLRECLEWLAKMAREKFTTSP